MSKNFMKVEKYVMEDDEYKLLSYSTSSESVEMADNKNLQTAIDDINKDIEQNTKKIDTKVDSIKINNNEYKNGTIAILPVYTINESDSIFGTNISLNIDNSTYTMTFELKNNKGEILSSKEIDFPIESMVVNAKYNENNKTLTLILQNGNNIDVDISSIISGLVPDNRTIAGLNLKDDISDAELRNAINVQNGAEVNQDSFSNIQVGEKIITANSKTDTLIIETNGNIDLDINDDKLIFSSLSADASFEDLSYSDYKSGNYDMEKNYAIPDYPYSDGDASKVNFDDSTAQINADNVQTAIETLAKKAKNIRVVTANFTTGNNGTVSSGVSLDTQNYILAAYAKGYDVRVYTNASGVQGFRVNTIKNDGTLTPLVNTEISITSVISDNTIAGGGNNETIEATISIPSDSVKKLSDNKARKTGNIVQISVGFSNSTMTGNNIEITIPEGFRPTVARYATAFGYSNELKSWLTFPITISPTGNVGTSWTSTTISEFYCNGTYII